MRSTPRRGGGVATRVERDNCAEAFQSASRGIVSRVARRAGIAGQDDVRVAREWWLHRGSRLESAGPTHRLARTALRRRVKASIKVSGPFFKFMAMARCSKVG